jgi:hypothetical protein
MNSGKRKPTPNTNKKGPTAAATVAVMNFKKVLTPISVERESLFVHLRNDFVAEGGPSSLSLLVARASFGLRPEQLLASPRRPPFENARHTVFPLNIERRELSHSKKLSHVSPVRGTPGTRSARTGLRFCAQIGFELGSVGTIRSDSRYVSRFVGRDCHGFESTLSRVANGFSMADKCASGLQKMYELRGQKGKRPTLKCSFTQVTLVFRIKGSAQPSQLKSGRTLILRPGK